MEESLGAVISLEQRILFFICSIQIRISVLWKREQMHQVQENSSLQIRRMNLSADEAVNSPNQFRTEFQERSVFCKSDVSFLE